ncbi:hypothetical protein A6J33_017665 [Pantoea sp. FDAARGOS_194]|uniref:hypothetical protein n=1 Tax=Pantoea TaxID=53335 RepID=UPI000BB59498|nr:MULTISPECIES: hypothetical protein [Pantoea]PNK64475.1 hypothetical protein A6J33_017665 [Pantoea sp. FDAARGOS_194]
MRERPILLNADMVRAVLNGSKTQTRRIITPQPFDRSWARHDHQIEIASGRAENGDEIDGLLAYTKSSGGEWHAFCPFGQPGDRLWVRETFRVHSRATDVATLVYKASGRQSWTEQTHRVPASVCNKPAVIEKWTPSIHMPRWASRITLEITGVRVERLTALSDDDARNEGCPAQLPHNPEDEHQARTWFRGLWSEIYGEESWQANLWVWVIEFKRVEGE